jgi:hypothetical protein
MMQTAASTCFPRGESKVVESGLYTVAAAAYQLMTRRAYMLLCVTSVAEAMW